MVSAPLAPPILALVGMSGVGKSRWSSRLEREGFRRFDCDRAIADELGELLTLARGEDPIDALGAWMGMPSSEGYAEREARYLALEARVTRAGVAEARRARREAEPFVLDCTGSVIHLDPALLEELREVADVVHLETSSAREAQLLASYLASPRPIVWAGRWQPEPGEDEARALERLYPALLRDREARYAALARRHLDADRLEALPEDEARRALTSERR